MIIEWWESLSLMMKILWGATLSASLIFIIETIMTFIGADTGGDLELDADFDLDGAAEMGSGANLYTFRNLVNFVLGFGWTSILLMDKISSLSLLFAIAILVGVLLVAIVMYIFKFLSGMQQSGTINVFKMAPGCSGKVYLSIPELRSGTGKVQITINDSLREYDAMTDGESLPTGTAVRVVEVIDGHTMLVERQDSIII